MKNIDNSQGILDVRDLIERIEELREERNEYVANEHGIPEEESPSWGEVAEANSKAEDKYNETDEGIELKNLEDFLEDFKGYGGDEKWEGDWYPVILIQDDYFTKYTKELLDDVGYIPKDFPSWIKIDWEETAENVKEDYTSGQFDGVTYWGR